MKSSDSFGLGLQSSISTRAQKNGLVPHLILRNGFILTDQAKFLTVSGLQDDVGLLAFRENALPRHPGQPESPRLALVRTSDADGGVAARMDHRICGKHLG